MNSIYANPRKTKMQFKSTLSLMIAILEKQLNR